MRTLLLRTIGVLSIGAGLVLACSSSSGTDGVTDGIDSGTTPPPTGNDASSGNDGATTSPIPCAANTDCASHLCNLATGVCSDPTCTDGVKNQNESDIDCGGACGKCDQNKACGVAADCKDGVCTGGKCAAPTNTDGVKNGNETGVDCGGTGNNPCADGQGCKTKDDCTSTYCKANVCTAIAPGDGVQNGNETDVDCGGVGNALCADTKKCLVDADCNSSYCLDTGDGNGLRCQVPSGTDGRKNGDETDVDCGGSSGNGCTFGLACKVGADCASGGCNYLKTCAHAKSCTAHYGGDTCGTGGAGGNGAQNWEDCCTTIPVTTTVGGKTETVYLDKYVATSGRVRAFLESINYDVRTFVQGVRGAGAMPKIPTKNNGTTRDDVNDVLMAAWDPYLPTSFNGTQDLAEIQDCDQGYWDYNSNVCCQTAGAEKAPQATSQALCDSYYGAGNTEYVAGDGTSEGGKCHYYNRTTKVCPAGRDGIYKGTYTAAKRHIGGTIFRSNPQTDTGCFPGSPGTHSYWFPPGVKDPPSSGDATYSQDVYDTKSMQCVDYLIAQAFCVWDGGRSETYAEWVAASNYIANNGSNWPWTPSGDSRAAKPQISGTFEGCRFPTMTDGNQASCPVAQTARHFDPATFSIELADYQYSYEYPTNLINADYIVFISPPGRTTGRGPLGHADTAGNVFEHTSSVSVNTATNTVFTASERWSSNGSWEVHNWPYGGVTGPLINKYGKFGIRCAKYAPN